MVSGWLNSQIPCGPFIPMNQVVRGLKVFSYSSIGRDEATPSCQDWQPRMGTSMRPSRLAGVACQ